MDTLHTNTYTNNFKTLNITKAIPSIMEKGISIEDRTLRDDEIIEAVKVAMGDEIPSNFMSQLSPEIAQKIYKKFVEWNFGSGFNEEYYLNLTESLAPWLRNEFDSTIKLLADYFLFKTLVKMGGGSDFPFVEYFRPTLQGFRTALSCVIDFTRFFSYMDSMLIEVNKEFEDNIRMAEKILNEYQENTEKTEKIKQEIIILQEKNSTLESELKDLVPKRNEESAIVSSYVADLKEINLQFQNLDQLSREITKEIRKYETRIEEMTVVTSDDIIEIRESVAHLEKLVAENSEKQKVYIEKHAELSKEDSFLEKSIKDFQSVNKAIEKLSKINSEVGKIIDEKFRSENMYNDLEFRADSLGVEATTLEKLLQDLQVSYDRAIKDLDDEISEVTKQNLEISNQISKIEAEIGNQSSTVAKSKKEVFEQQRKNQETKAACDKIMSRADRVVENLKSQYASYCDKLHSELAKI